MDELTGLLKLPGGTYRVTMEPVPEPSKETRRDPRTSYGKVTRIHLLSVQGHRCAICRGPLGLYESHVDHIVPRSAGGTDDYSNLQLTHMNCNLRKGAGKRSPYDADTQEPMPWG
jgi:5-methylcytosine-specific restriction endonuclease McrA